MRNRRTMGLGRIRVATLSVVTLLAIAACSSGATGSNGSSGAASGSAPKLGKITVGIQSQDVQPQALVKPMGWYDKNAGAPVTYADFNGGGAMNQAFQTGDLDIAEMGTPPFALGLNKGIPYKLVFVDNTTAKFGEGLVVRQDSGITSVKQLVGKTVATPSGSSSDYMFGRTLQVNNVSPDQVNLLNLDPGAIGAAWKSKHIDAAYIWAPVLQSLMADGGNLISSTADLTKDGDFDGDIIAVRTDFATQHPEEVLTFVKAMICANNFANSRSPAAMDMLGKTFNLPASQFSPDNMAIPTVQEQQGPTFFGGSPPGLVKILKGQTQYFFDKKLAPKLASDATINSAVDGSFLAKAVQEVGTGFACS